jgi:hypothetical protein
MFLDLKGHLLSLIPLTNDAIHIYIGLVSYLGLCVVLRRPLSWWPALVPGAVVGLAIEVVDIAHGAHPLWSLKDTINQNLWPVAVWFVVRYLAVGEAERRSD